MQNTEIIYECVSMAHLEAAARVVDLAMRFARYANKQDDPDAAMKMVYQNCTEYLCGTLEGATLERAESLFGSINDAEVLQCDPWRLFEITAGVAEDFLRIARTIGPDALSARYIVTRDNMVDILSRSRSLRA